MASELVRGDRATCVAFLMGAEDGPVYTVGEVKRGRTLTQNAYYWAMLSKLGNVLGMPQDELHERMLDDYGACDVLNVLASVPLGDYFAHYRVMSEYEHGGMRWRMVKVLKGSSKMDSEEFGRLIDGMREECEIQGIDVMTPEEIAKLRFIEPQG